ncbi:hypothetical protein QR680_015544 [Steinernema hermaphroditum]|uniref:Metalloendopeptidase n=1 Tax=Steinernema hermaphroditum TaxID=289476 RepID=A0AA39LKT1_9BILA|nr:hypothetical protein QR680_015544 [Steinernema hermaphroditum]
MFYFVLVVLLFVTSSAIRLRRAINDDNNPEYLWQTDRPIPFTFYSDFAESDRPAVRDVFRAIAARTCLTFKEVPEDSVTYKSDTTIAFFNGTKCVTSQIGKNRNQVGFPIILKEKTCRSEVNYFEHIFYALGLQPTQQRADRDDYITFYENRTQPERVSMFEKYTSENSKDFDVPYDFDSVLHITPDVFNLNGQPTIVAKDPLYQYAVGRNIYTGAHSDYLQLNRLYKCLDKCQAENAVCENGGYVNPHNCSECSCPRGFAGPLCAELDYNEATHKGCGGQIDVTGSWKELSIQRDANENNISCHWFLQAPQDSHIEIKIASVAPENQLCTFFTKTWLEIRSGDFTVGGYKFFCGNQIPKLPIKNLGNFVVVTLSQDYSDPTSRIPPTEMETTGYVGLAMIIISIVGIFGNFNIIVATIRKKRLQSNSGLLLCVLASFDLTCLLFDVVNGTWALLGIALTKPDCFKTVMVYCCAQFASNAALLGLAFDRLFAVTFPVKYMRFSVLYTLFGAILPGLFLGATFVILGSLYTLDDSVKEHRSRNNNQFLSTLRTHEKAMRSITIFLLFFVGTYFFSRAMLSIPAPSDGSTGLLQDIISNTMMFPVIIAYSQCYFVYFWRNMDYREAFMEQLGLSKFKSIKVVKQTTVATVTLVRTK